MSTRPNINLQGKKPDHLLLMAGALISLLPFVCFAKEFGQLFWFGDDWDLLDQISKTGTWTWTWQVFAENFVPVFKLFWSGAVHLFGGSYHGMLTILWLTHAFNTYQFGRVLRRHGFSWLSALVSQMIFGLTPANLETLGWATQWSAVLSTTFFLIGLEVLAEAVPLGTDQSRKKVSCLVGMSACSALSFSRGILTGCIFALSGLWPSALKITFTQRACRTLLFVLPGIIVAALILGLATGNHQHLGGHILDAADYGLWLYCMNPLYRLLEVDSWGLRTFATMAVLKILVVGWALIRADRMQRRLLLLLLAFDLGNAVLLGIGRYHTGLSTTISSRYQYSILIATLPSIALWLEKVIIGGLSHVRIPRMVGITALIALLFLLVWHRWPSEIAGFANSRGTVTRNIIFQDPNPPEDGAIPGIPFMKTSRAKALTKEFNLH